LIVRYGGRSWHNRPGYQQTLFIISLAEQAARALRTSPAPGPVSTPAPTANDSGSGHDGSGGGGGCLLGICDAASWLQDQVAHSEEWSRTATGWTWSRRRDSIDKSRKMVGHVRGHVHSNLQRGAQLANAVLLA
jgi:hypothetical protein